MTRYAITAAGHPAYRIISTQDGLEWEQIASVKNRDTAALIAQALNEHADLDNLRNDLENQT